MNTDNNSFGMTGKTSKDSSTTKQKDTSKSKWNIDDWINKNEDSEISWGLGLFGDDDADKDLWLDEDEESNDKKGNYEKRNINDGKDSKDGKKCKAGDKNCKSKSKKSNFKTAGLFVFTFGVLLIVVLIVVGITIGYDYFGDDNPRVSDCNYPIKTNKCSANNFTDHCEDNIDDCVISCNTFNPRSISDDVCKYKDICKEYADVDLNNCEISQDQHISELNGYPIRLENYLAADAMNVDETAVSFFLNYIPGISNGIQMPKNDVNVIAEITEYFYKSPSTWYVRWIGGNECLFISASYPELCLVGDDRELRVQYIGNTSGSNFPKEVVFEVDIYQGNGYTIKAHNGYYVHLYVLGDKTAHIDLDSIDHSDDRIAEYIWFINSSISRTYPISYDIDNYSNVFSLEEFNAMEKQYVKIDPNRCNLNYLRIITYYVQSYYGTDTNSVNNEFCFNTAYAYMEYDNLEYDTYVIRAAIETKNNRSISGSKNQTFIGNRVFKTEYPNESDNRSVYLKFTGSRRFMMSSITVPEAYVGLFEDNCVENSGIDLYWTDDPGEAVQFEYVEGYGCT